jgi:hypothetical protein
MLAARSIIVRDIQTNASIIPGAPGFNLVLLSTSGAEPAIWTQVIEFPKSDFCHPQFINPKKIEMPIGAAMLWVGDDKPQLLWGSFGVAEIRKILEGLAKRNIPSAHGFDPPFAVVALDDHGINFVDGDQTPCTKTHPLPRQGASRPR